MSRETKKTNKVWYQIDLTAILRLSLSHFLSPHLFPSFSNWSAKNWIEINLILKMQFLSSEENVKVSLKYPSTGWIDIYLLWETRGQFHKPFSPTPVIIRGAVHFDQQNSTQLYLCTQLKISSNFYITHAQCSMPKKSVNLHLRINCS